MSNKLDSHQENIAAIMNAMAESVKDASDEDIIAEAKAEQQDINIKSASIRNLLKKAVVDHHQSDEVINASATNEDKSAKTTLEAHFSQKIEISEDKELAKVDLSIVYQSSNRNNKKFKTILQMWRSLVNLFTQKRYSFWPQLAFASLFVLFCLFSGLIFLMVNNNSDKGSQIAYQPSQNIEPNNKPSPAPNHTNSNGEQSTTLPSNNSSSKGEPKLNPNPNPNSNSSTKINSSSNSTNPNHEKKPGPLRSGSAKLNIAALKEVKTIFIDLQEEEFTNNIYQQLIATGKAQTSLDFLDDRDKANARLRIKVDNSLVKFDLISGSEVIWSKQENFTEPSLIEAERLAKIIITQLTKDIESAAN